MGRQGVYEHLPQQYMTVGIQVTASERMGERGMMGRSCGKVKRVGQRLLHLLIAKQVPARGRLVIGHWL